MAKFVMANRRAGKFHEPEKRGSRRALDAAFQPLAGDVDVLHDFAPPDDTLRRVIVFEADPVELAARAPALPADVMLEPEILHYPANAVPLDLLAMHRAAATPAALAGDGSGLQVEARGNGAPLEGAEVILFLRGFGDVRAKLEGHTGPDGRVAFTFSPFFQPLGFIVAPAGDFWDVLVRGGRGTVAVDCPPLPADGPLQWWHRAFGVDAFEVTRGGGVRVGVIDSGCGPHPCLAHATDIGAFIDGAHDPGGGADVDSHGSHVCGIVGARPAAPGQYAGLAPGAELFSARVFPPGRGANQGDIANAIDALSRSQGADLINMSLGAPVPSQIERDAIIDALERGTLCVCAAANSAGPVEWPAAFPETLAISALGLLGWGPPGSQASLALPDQPDRFGDGGLFLAGFSCFGPEIVGAAPGVGIISTVPARHGLAAPYSPKNGTSMASPAACGALAAALATSGAYLALARNRTRAEMARSIFTEMCRDIGLRSEFQGHGVPSLG